MRSRRNSSPSYYPSTSRQRWARATEIATWANAASALAVAAGVTAVMWTRLPAYAIWMGLGGGVLAFAALRLSLAHRFTLWIAAAFGTLTIAALGGGLFWLFAHVLESPAAPSIAGVVGAIVAAVGPAWGYGHLARDRAEARRDSLQPISVPRSS